MPRGNSGNAKIDDVSETSIGAPFQIIGNGQSVCAEKAKGDVSI